MEEKEENDNGRTTDLMGDTRDGSIDFARYSLEQLTELQYTLDRRTFPRNFDNLLAELERRRAATVRPSTSQHRLQPEPQANSHPRSQREAPHEVSHELPGQPQPAAVTGRFTPYGGLRGWLHAKAKRLAVYGEGFIEVRAQEVVLGGWQRTWVGVAYRSELFIPLDDISDVIQGDGVHGDGGREGDWIRFRYETPLGRHRSVEFQAGSIQQASTLTASLPAVRSAGYERWSAVREFNARLRAVGYRPWLTAAIVIANVAVFAAMMIALRTVAVREAPQMSAWGANFGPLTLHGQLWRLISALFLHGNIPHLLFNMWALWNVGRLTERLYGNWAYAFLYFASGALSGLASIVWDPSRPTIGASGAIFGIFGAFIAFSIHPRSRVSVTVPPALWVSALVFALYNLVSSFFTAGIDNAAHVGGLISGLLLGLVMVRPLNRELRRSFPIKRMVGAAVLTAVVTLAALWQARGLGDQLTGPERYLRTHLWYVSGERENLRKWQEIATEAGSGRLSSVAVGDRFEREILPFWETATPRLKTEAPSLPADERPLASLVADFARLRLEWSRAVVDATKGGDPNRASDAAQFEKETDLAVARTERIALLASLDHRPRALANSRWVIAATKWFTERHWKCIEPPAVIRRSAAPGDSKADGPGARQSAGCRAQRLFMSGDYESLDAWMEHSAASIGDLP
ncbi:MAG: rhomboid family intramembrane serine protease, partial [Steroidobacteraceae bacterium]